MNNKIIHLKFRIEKCIVDIDNILLETKLNRYVTKLDELFKQFNEPKEIEDIDDLDQDW